MLIFLSPAKSLDYKTPPQVTTHTLPAFLKQSEILIKQLRKLIDVTRVDDLSERLCVTRELALARVRTTPETRSEIIQIVDIYRAEVVDVALDSMVVQIVGSEERVDSLLGLLENFGLMEMVRTGRVAMQRGSAERRKRGSSVWRAHANGLEAATAKDLFSTSGV